jgi:hypothetical protein
MQRPNSESSLIAPAPIIKTRIPIDLKAVFLAAQRGEEVTKAPPCANKTFQKWKGAKTPNNTSSDTDSETITSKSRRLVFGNEEDKVVVEPKPKTCSKKKSKQCRWSSEVSKAASLHPPRLVPPSTSCEMIPCLEQDYPRERRRSSGRWDIVGVDQSSNMPKLPNRKRSVLDMRDILEAPTHCCLYA